MTKQEEIIVGLDIGTTKICAIVGQATDDGIDIIGIGSHPSRGLRKGVVVNIESTVESIKKAVEEAFAVKVESVRTQNVLGKVKRQGKNIGRRSSWKKALVTLKQGNSIPIFEGA